MKRILFFFSNTMVGGAETNILKISKELSEFGFQVYFAALEDNGPLISENNLYNVFTEIGRYETNPIKSFINYKKLLKDSKIDIVSSFGLRVDLFVRILSKKIRPGIKILSNIRASENWRKPHHSYIDMLTKKHVDQWVSNSISANETFIRREKINPNKTTVIYNFIEFEKKEVFLNKNTIFTVGVLANYKASKGHFNLIPIAKKLKKLNFDFQFYCAGHDYTNGKLKALIIENSLENHIILQGHISDKKNFFETIDLFFLPSYIEGLSTSMIEAMSFGVPVVSSNVDGLPEAIENGVNGFTRNPDDLEGFVTDIIKLQDLQLQDKFINNSYSVLNSKFNKEVNVAKWVSSFNDI